MTFEPQHTPATHDFIPRSHSISSHPTRLLTSTPSSHKLTSSAPMSCPSAMLPPPPTTLTTSLPLPLTKNPRTDLLDPSSRPPPSALSSRLLSSPNEPTSSPDSSYPTACDQQTSSGSSTNSIVAPCSPASNSSPPLLHVPSPHLPRIRKIHIDFSYRKPTPNLTPVEPTPEELLAQDFRFLTHEPRQPLCEQLSSLLTYLVSFQSAPCASRSLPARSVCHDSLSTSFSSGLSRGWKGGRYMR